MEKRFKVLLATDYSEATLYAEYYAIQFAKSTNSEIRIINAYEIPLSYTPPKIIEYSKMLDNFRKSELKKLKHHFDKLIQSLSIMPDELNYSCVVREGSAADMIGEEAGEWHPDFIIMGTHGVSGFREVLFGTHTWQLIKKSNIPVLAIPKAAVFKKIENIVFAIEQRDGEIPAVSFVVELAKEFNAHVTFVHATNYALSKEFETHMFKDFIKDIKENLSYNKVNFKLIFKEDVVIGLNEFCLKTNAEWLVVSHEEPSMLERIVMQNYSTSKQISFHAHLPLLAIPDSYNPGYSEFLNEFEVKNEHLT